VKPSTDGTARVAVDFVEREVGAVDADLIAERFVEYQLAPMVDVRLDRITLIYP
jgi:hypothetical protein